MIRQVYVAVGSLPSLAAWTLTLEKRARINIKIKAYILLFLSITHNLPTAGYYTSALVTFFNQKFTKLVYK